METLEGGGDNKEGMRERKKRRGPECLVKLKFTCELKCKNLVAELQ